MCCHLRDVPGCEGGGGAPVTQSKSRAAAAAIIVVVGTLFSPLSLVPRFVLVVVAVVVVSTVHERRVVLHFQHLYQCMTRVCG